MSKNFLVILIFLSAFIDKTPAQTYCTPTFPVVCSLSSMSGPRTIMYGMPEVSVMHDDYDCTTWDYTSIKGRVYKNIENVIRFESVTPYLGIHVFIDYNRDGDFDDGAEFVYSNNAPSWIVPLKVNFKVPCSVAPGDMRMRVIYTGPSFATVSSACQNFSTGGGSRIGEFKDYTLEVLPDTIRKLYVDQSASASSQDGLTWATALKDLADAVKIAECYSSIDTIFVAGGVYVPKYSITETDDYLYNRSFVFKRDSLAIMGGYAPGGTIRNYELYPTILSGDLVTEKSLHVITVMQNAERKINNSLHFNGLVIQDGSADGLGTLYIGLNPYSNYSGGGAFIFNADPSFYNCVFRNNYSNYNGAAINLEEWSTVPIINCLFYDNTSSSHAALKVGVGCNFDIRNSTFHGNAPAAIYADWGWVWISNSIIWGNSAGTIGGNFDNPQYSLIQGRTSTDYGNISGDTNPLFINSAAKNFKLLPSSPVINKGNNGYVVTPLNLDYSPRIEACRVDMGAYEYDSSVSIVDIDTVYFTICAGDSINLDSTHYYTGSGAYLYTFTRFNDCDSLVILQLDVVPSLYYDTIELCNGQLYGGRGVAGDYIDTFVNVIGCDSIVHLHLIIYPTYTDVIDSMVCAGESVYGYTATGIYNDTFVSVNGCDSVRILNLTVHPTQSYTVDTAICQGADVWGYNLPGIYYDTFVNVYGCDSVRIVDLTVYPIYTIYDTITACEGDTIFGYTSSGYYADTFATIYGCDSVRNLSLTVNPRVYTNITDTICSGEILYGYTATGLYVDTFANINGCDSIVTLNLYVAPIYRDTHSLILCTNQLPYSYLGVNIPIGSLSSTAYDSVLFSTSMGCDSLIVLDVLIHDTSAVIIDTLLCFGSSMVWNGIEISSAGVYSFTTDNMNGCDSITVLNVFVPTPPEAASIFLSNCGSVTHEGIAFVRDTLIIDTFRNVYGCDSFYRNVHIEVKEIVYDTIYAEICSGAQFLFNGTAYTTTTVHTDKFVNDNGCDSFITLNLKVHPLPNVRILYDNPDGILCMGDTVQLYLDYAYEATYYDGFDRPLGSDRVQNVRLNQAHNAYYIIATDTNTCASRTDISIPAIHCCEIQIPNAFSPNGDGVNDNFGIVTLGNPQNYVMQIYNRLGNLVFISYSPAVKWDGLIDGKTADAGVYFYLVKSDCSDGTPFLQKGELHLIR